MAIVEMKKLTLCGMSAERDQIFDALATTGAVQIVNLADSAQPQATADRDELVALSARITDTIEWLTEAAKEKKYKLPDAYRDVSLTEFLAYGERKEEFCSVLTEIGNDRSEILRLTAENNKLSMLAQAVRTYASFDVRFCDCVSGTRTRVTLGTVSEEGVRLLKSAWGADEPVTVAVGASNGQSVPVLVLAHASLAESLERVLSESAFAPCPFTDESTPTEKLAQIEREIADNTSRQQTLRDRAAERALSMQELKTYGDYVAYLLQKQTAADGIALTARTYAMQAFVPTTARKAVEEAIAAVTKDCWYEFSDPTEQDEVPTLLKNNPVSKQFESVVNMYAAPSYTEIDPSFILSIFFILFFGFIMADIGYGILLTVGAFAFAATKKRDSGLRRLVYVIGAGGVFSLVFGFLFGSFFGLTHEFWSVIPPAVLPDPIEDSQTLLIYTLLAGAVHLMIAFILNGLKGLKRGSVTDFIFDGLVWAIFFLALMLLMWHFLPGLLGTTLAPLPKWLADTALYTAGGTLLIEMIASGRKEKGFGKAKKAFGAVYGLIGFMSDILSYARLYGLMLSGAIIANIVSEMSIQMMTSVGGVVGGVLILLIGHVFNLAMGALGAYVHDLRLQYIEFFSRFYEGEGELFRPLGSSLQYTTIKR